MESSVHSIPLPVLFHEVFVHLDLGTIFNVFLASKAWWRASKDHYFWENLAKTLWKEHFMTEKYTRPEQKDWKWVCQSKKPLKDKTGFSGIGCVDENNKRYEGEWVNGVQCGFGCLYWPPSGDRYQGQFQNGVPNGFGIRIWGKGKWEGDRYEGEFVDNFRTGKGKYYWPKGDMYIGDFVENMEHGKGVYIWANGNRYEGDFYRNKQHGKGVHIWANGNRYEGDYYEDKRHGHGVVHWANGNSYVGEFFQNKQHGKGVHIWANGNKYEGEYFEDQKHGEGIFTEANGWVIKERWVEGIPMNLPNCLNPVIVDAIKRKVCTFAATKQNYYGQLFYSLSRFNSTKSGQKPARVCVVCAEVCVPKFGEAMLPKPVFAGALYCDCGHGFDDNYNCRAHPHHSENEMVLDEDDYKK
jgi:hypothetical protein